ncbi:hypothetical protein [uncultured Corynebacterium sp.]|uniref:hypothetical protein n=1 Tax=uncultured Corynebacterium sp. TaxID=159447 RepID=UPI002609067A|nr:hypothetical protein [uncultured Corynebacterium sp.]
MTPEQARKLLEGTTPGPREANHECQEGGTSGYEQQYSEVSTLAVTYWVGEHAPASICRFDYHEGEFPFEDLDYIGEMGDMRKDAELMAAAPGMAAMIAGMTTEYAVQIPNGELVGVGWSSYETAREHRDAWRRDGYDANIVRRFVTAPQPLGEDQ